MKTSLRCLAFSVLFSLPTAAQVNVLTNLPYKSGENLSDYERERCVLDLYLPTNRPFPTLIWLHGGGLVLADQNRSNTAAIARAFATDGIAVANANYRLSPRAQFPAYVEDTAAVFAWTRANIAAHGGNSNDVFVGGHSAGAYLASMIGMDPSWLARHNLKPANIAGLVPVSGQMLTHFTVRDERGITNDNTVIADAAAPIYHTRRDAPPQILFMGDKDWPARLEENQYFVAMQRVAGNSNVTLHVISNRNHGTIAQRIPQPHDPVRTNIVNFIRAHSGN